MKITVRVKPRKREQKVEEHDGVYWVWLRSVPEGGKANRELIRILADHFDVTPNSVQIVSGHTSRSKTIEVNTKMI